MKQISSTLSTLFIILVAVALQWPLRSLPPRLVDQCGRDADARFAPIIVVGVIESDSVVLRPVPMHSDRRTPLQMRKMQVAVENVIRGDIQDQHVGVFYFTWAGGFDGPQPLGMWSVGNRRILWLRRDGSVLRTECDGWDGCTWGVYSGKHQKVRTSPESIDRALADIVLTRGAGSVNETQFAAAILRGAPVADAYAIDNYRQLAVNERGVVKAAACEALWILGHDPVLRTFAADGIHEANCRCPVVRGEADCGSTSQVHADPPY